MSRCAPIEIGRLDERIAVDHDTARVAIVNRVPIGSAIEIIVAGAAEESSLPRARCVRLCLAGGYLDECGGFSTSVTSATFQEVLRVQD